MPLLETKGAGSAQGFGFVTGAGGKAPVYVEDVFSTYLYTGNGATQTITNGIDLAGEGGMVWIKSRTNAFQNMLHDTSRGANYYLTSDTSGAQLNPASNTLTAFNSSGFSVGANNNVNYSGDGIVSWTFREAEKFFSVVTYTGTGVARTVSHSLGAAPGCMIIKRTDSAADWTVYHRSVGATDFMVLNATSANQGSSTRWNNTEPTSTSFSVGTAPEVNASGGSYVAYLFAHDAGGFGADGTDNVISCGTYAGDNTTTGSKLVSLDFEPQYLIVKSQSSGDWYVSDVMRGMNYNGTNAWFLKANTTGVEGGYGDWFRPDPQGFRLYTNNTAANASGTNYIYIAIRRPMKVPEVGTEVFSPQTYSGDDSALRSLTVNFPVDSAFFFCRQAGSFNRGNFDRLRGDSVRLRVNDSEVEATNTGSATVEFDSNTLLLFGGSGGFSSGINFASQTYAVYPLKRAPGFFDVVCYTGNASSSRQVPHNLGVTPELIIVKQRDASSSDWIVRWSGNISNNAILNSSSSFNATNYINDATSAYFQLASTGTPVNTNTYLYIAYLFATCPGVSKVGSYTGTGSTLQVDCGFASGARLVIIKRTDSTGDWYVWDSARGIVASNDPYMLVNTTDAEVTGTDYVDTYSAGFEISSTAPAAINASGGTFIFLAIA